MASNFYEAFAQGQANGLERQRAVTQRNQLAELQSLAPQVMSGDLDATSRAFSLDPTRAQSYQTEGNRQQQQLVGLAKTLKQYANNPQMQAGVYRSALPYLKRNFGAEIPDDFDPASVMPIVDQVLAVAENAPSVGGAGNTLQSQRILEDGSILNTYRDGRTENTGLKADRRQWFRDQPGFEPEIVNADGTTTPIGGAPAPARGGQGISVGQGAGALRMNIEGIPAEQQQRMAKTVSMMQQAGYPEAEIMGFLQSQLPPDVPGLPMASPAAPQTMSRARPTAAQDAMATEMARQQVQQRYLPDELAMRTQAAIQQAGGSAQAKGEAEARLDAVQNLPRVMQESTNAINLIDQALNHPGLATAVGASGRADPRNYLPGTDATDFRVLLDQIKGGTFLQAFQSLKGGGAITEVEGTKAEQAIARLNRDQSEPAFRQSLQDLREVARSAIVRAQTKAQSAGGGRPGMQAPGGAPRQIQSAEEYNALPPGALFIAPDGTQRRKR